MTLLTKTKIRIAFVKYGGLSAGGTEKFLQTIAANLDRDKFEVDYFYCDTTPYIGSSFVHPGTNSERKKYMEENGVRLIEFKVGYKDVTKRNHLWRETNFWEKFDGRNYDIIQTGRAGHPEYPFTEIKKTPIVDSIHFLGGIDNQYNISRVMHISQWSANKWVHKGGDKNRVIIVSHPIQIDDIEYGSLVNELKLENKFVYGFHQRNDNDIFSPIPLESFKHIECDANHFIILGGGSKYRDQAKALGIKNITFLNHTGNPHAIYKFLSTLHVYSHGRKDGEVNSTAMAEAMFFGLPIVSHTSAINNGHIECIGGGGKVVSSLDEYTKEMRLLEYDKEYYAQKSSASYSRFKEKYELHSQIKNIESVYQEIVANPFPNKVIRFISSFRLRYYLIYGPKKVFQKVTRQSSL